MRINFISSLFLAFALLMIPPAVVVVGFVGFCIYAVVTHEERPPPVKPAVVEQSRVPNSYHVQTPPIVTVAPPLRTPIMPKAGQGNVPTDPSDRRRE